MPALERELTLAGADAREAAELAALLERAATPARFDVSHAEVEAALERARPRRRPIHLPRVSLAAAAVAAAALTIVLVVPRGQEDVQARALDALGGADRVLHLREEVFTRATGFDTTTTRDVWYDPARRRTRWTDIGFGGNTIAITLAAPGRFQRLLVQAGVQLRGTSCRSIAAGCAQVLDPVARYRDALARADVRPVRTTFNGRETYRFTLPLQPGLQQIVYVDTETLLPRSIVWQEGTGRLKRVVSTVDVTDVERVARADVPANAFAAPRGGRPVRVVPAGRLLTTRPLRLVIARRMHPFWLGRRGLTDIVERRYARGNAVVFRYGELEVWTYGGAIPSELLAPRFLETKTVDVGGRPATFFGLDGRSAVARDGSPSVVVVGFASKEDLFGALGRAHPLR